MNPHYPFVSSRARHACEYCRAPEIVFNLPFEVEHITPQAQGGETIEENLALSCRSCNLYKSDYISAVDELTGQDVTWAYEHQEIPLEAPLEAPVMERMARALLAEDPGSVVVPYCMSGGTDAKQFSRLGMTCYGFTPLVLPEGYDYYAMFHGIDERIPLSALEASVRIMDRFLTGPQVDPEIF